MTSLIAHFLALSDAERLDSFSKLPPVQKRRVLELLQEYGKRRDCKFNYLFPDADDPERGIFARHGYNKHVEFFEAGSKFRSRLFMAGNRVGKTIAGTFEDTCHATGMYPHWWVGKRFDHATDGWVAGKTNETTRDILQKELFGKVIWQKGRKTFDGSGLIPKHLIGTVTWRQGVSDLADVVNIRHRSGKWSSIGLKSYQQGRGSFEGTAKHWIHFDEEPPIEVYTEGLTRTATTEGIVLITFTPLEGTTEMVDDFIKKSAEGTNFMVQAGWDNAPHLDEKTKTELLASFPKHEHEARSKGIPYAGTGMIFPVDEKAITVKPFIPPPHWPRIGGLDFGWDHPTGAAVLAWDRDKDIIYVIADYRERQLTPEQHSRHLRDFGDWLPWAWPHDGLQHDKGSGDQLAEQYTRNGLNMLPERATWDDGTNGVEAGLFEMLERMEQGRWKVFEDCTAWLEERRMYHREKGKVVKLKDDAISASRYAYMMLRHAVTKPSPNSKQRSKPNWRTT